MHDANHIEKSADSTGVGYFNMFDLSAKICPWYSINPIKVNQRNLPKSNTCDLRRHSYALHVNHIANRNEEKHTHRCRRGSQPNERLSTYYMIYGRCCSCEIMINNGTRSHMHNGTIWRAKSNYMKFDTVILGPSLSGAYVLYLPIFLFYPMTRAYLIIYCLNEVLG